MPFTKIKSGSDKGKYKSPSGRIFTSGQVKLYYVTNGFKRKPKAKIKVNNKLKYYGETDTDTGQIQINRKKHKGNKRELADTIAHELYHVKHPKATEKTAYKKTKKKMSSQRVAQLLKKLT